MFPKRYEGIFLNICLFKDGGRSLWASFLNKKAYSTQQELWNSARIFEKRNPRAELRINTGRWTHPLPISVFVGSFIDERFPY